MCRAFPFDSSVARIPCHTQRGVRPLTAGCGAVFPTALQLFSGSVWDMLILCDVVFRFELTRRKTPPFAI